MAEGDTNRPRPLVVGANHRSSSLMLRDRLFVEDDAMDGFLRRLHDAGIGQAIVMSTCDRVEIQAAESDHEASAQRIAAVLAEHAQLRPSDLAGQVYVLSDEEAVRHIFAVASSLDSLVIGEPQVLGQVKTSHRVSSEAGLAGSELERVLQAAYGCAKRVRTETAVGQRPVSIAAAAAALARDLHGDLSRCRGLLIGAGDMGELVARDMLDAGLSHLSVTHPTETRAETLARTLDCHVAQFDDLGSLLPETDIVLTSLGARSHTITGPMVADALKQRRNRPMFLVDTGIPGDIDPAVDGLGKAFLYDLNDLERVAMEGRATRESEARAAWKILDAEVAGFLKHRAERAAVPALVRLRRHFESVRDGVMAEAGNDADKATRLLINRLLHGPSEALRGLGADSEAAGTEKADWEATEKLLRQVFRENPPPDDDDGGADGSR